ncbi:MAG: hypothetical protein H6686_01050 [Fibrobacteria bacterium]|nr:hypothetical protein [Fibrobacteria bacterium]
MAFISVLSLAITFVPFIPFYSDEILISRAALVLTGTGGTILIFCLALLIDRICSGIVRRSILLIGTTTMSIYLFHATFESAIRISIYQSGIRHHLPFELGAFIACIVAISAPILLQKYMIDRYGILQRLLLGDTSSRKK